MLCDPSGGRVRFWSFCRGDRIYPAPRKSRLQKIPVTKCALDTEAAASDRTRCPSNSIEIAVARVELMRPECDLGTDYSADSSCVYTYIGPIIVLLHG